MIIKKILSFHEFIQVDANVMFVQFLVSHIENNSKTCNYNIVANGKKIKVSKDISICENEVWENITIDYGKINMYLENLKLSFKKSYGKIVVHDFTHNILTKNLLKKI